MTRVILGVTAVLVVLAGMVAVGRREARHQRALQVQGIEQVRAAVGAVDSPTLTAYRTGADGYRCLDYRRGDLLYALELCFDGSFRVLDASDRRGAQQVVYSIRLDRNAPVPVLPASEAEAALHRLERRAVHFIVASVKYELEPCVQPFSKWNAKGGVGKAQVQALAWCRQAAPILAAEVVQAGMSGVPGLEPLVDRALALDKKATTVLVGLSTAAPAERAQLERRLARLRAQARQLASRLR